MSNPISTAVLNYWQEHTWKVHYNQFPIEQICDQRFKKCEMEYGVLPLPDGHVWIAPYVFKNKTNQFWIPIWLPASIKNQTISIRDNIIFPWVGPQQFSLLHNLSPFRESFSFYENYLRFDCIQEGQLIWQDWSTLLSAADDLLDQLGNDWKRQLTEMGYTLLEEVIVHCEQTVVLPSNLLLQEFAAVPDWEAQQLEDPDEDACEEITVSPGQWLTVDVVHQKNKEAFVEKYIKEKKSIYLYTPFTPNLVEELNSEEQIKNLQDKDELLENKLAQLKSWQVQKNLFKSSIWSWLGKSKKIAPEKLEQIEALLEEKVVDTNQLSDQISNSIRKIIVERTKIHQQLVDIVEAPRTLDRNETKKEWQLYSLNENHKWEKASKIPDMDTLLIDFANLLLPSQLLGLLAKTQKAVFLGTNLSLQAQPLMSVFEDELSLQKYIQDETIIEEMQYRGMLLSNGNAFKIARVSHQVVLIDEYNYEDSLVQGLEIQGEVLPVNNQYQNLIEADFIAKWLKNYENKDKVVITTPFYAQKMAILSALQDVGVKVDVLNFYDLNGKDFEEIVFSPVYQLSSTRPFVFDQDENLLNSLMMKATKKLWIIGDIRIFDAKMHSPSGFIGKKVQMTVES